MLRLSEAQQLLDALSDPLLRPALKQFCTSQANEHVGMLLRQIRCKERDVMKEAALAGKVDAYETMFSELEHFAGRMMKEATQV